MTPLVDLTGRTALVTGGAAGIGKAVAHTLAGLGAHVAVADRDLDGARLVADAVGGEAFYFEASDASSCAGLVAAVVERFGGLQLAVNNAGGGGTRAPTGELSAEAWRRELSVYLDGVFYALHAQIGAMLQAGGGSVVNIASIFGAVATPLRPGYVSAKHAVVGLTKSTAIAYATRGIRINAVGPAFVQTGPIERLDAERRAGYESSTPMGRLATPTEVANVVAFLLSDAASYCTGAYYPVDGGWTAQ